jgi:hypothetical protein
LWGDSSNRDAGRGSDLTEIDDVEILFGQALDYWAAAVPSLRVPHLTSNYYQFFLTPGPSMMGIEH